MIHGFDDSTKEKVNISECFVVEQKHVADFGETAAGGLATSFRPSTKEGYKYLGIVGWQVVGAGIFVKTLYKPVNSANIQIQLYNASSSSVTPELDIFILYVKDEA